MNKGFFGDRSKRVVFELLLQATLTDRIACVASFDGRGPGASVSLGKGGCGSKVGSVA